MAKETIQARYEEVLGYEIHFFEEQILELEKDTQQAIEALKNKQFRLDNMRRHLVDLKAKASDLIKICTK